MHTMTRLIPPQSFWQCLDLLGIQLLTLLALAILTLIMYHTGARTPVQSHPLLVPLPMWTVIQLPGLITASATA